MTRIIIRAVQERQHYVDYLQQNLSDAEICWDTTRNAMNTFLDALRMAGEDAVIHMEDDAVLARDFRSRIEAEINKQPDKVIQFFSMRKGDLEIGSRWDSNFLSAVCFYFPKGYSKELLAYFPVWHNRKIHPTGLDTMVGDWLKKRKERYWIVVPNLANHQIGKSAVDPRRSSRRLSKTFRGMKPKAYVLPINGEPQVVTLSPCKATDFKELWEQAIAERIANTIGEVRTTSHYIMKNGDNETLGFCGIQFYSTKAIFKNDYVVPKFRKNGLWNVMYDYREWVVRTKPMIKTIEATCTDMSLNLYLRKGAVIVQRLSTLTKVRKAL